MKKRKSGTRKLGNPADLSVRSRRKKGADVRGGSYSPYNAFMKLESVDGEMKSLRSR